MRQLSLAKTLYNDYKTLLSTYIDASLTWRLDKIEDVQCDCDPCHNADRQHTYHWRDKIASTESQSEYLHFEEKNWSCDVYTCDINMHFVGERTNGMEMKAERDSYRS